jgi:putative ATPase
LAVSEERIQRKMVVYDKKGQQHFDALSAYQKAMRGSDPDAALYWLAKMIHAGEDPHIIARRLCVSASEDVGMANSMAVLVAYAAWEAVDRIGLPEAKHNLAHATVYVATSPKSSSTSVAIEAALENVNSSRTQPMPDHLHDKHSPGTGRNFLYKHPKDFPGNFVAQDYLGADLIFYKPSEQGEEKAIKPLVEDWRRQFQQERASTKISPPPKTSTATGPCSECRFAVPAFAVNFECNSKGSPMKCKEVEPNHTCKSFKSAPAR